MFPVLFRFPDSWPLIGTHGIHSYGVMVALGFLFGMRFVKRESERVHLDSEKMLDLFFWIMVWSIVGARTLYIINSANHFWSDPLMLFRIWEGGLVFQGGVIASIITAWVFLKRHKIPFFKVSDVFAPALALGHALGRIGCFFAGCCFGRECALPFPISTTFPFNPDSVAPAGIALYSTQLMESAGEFFIFAILFWYRKRKPFDGAVFLSYIIGYSLLRSLVETLRGDSIRGFVIDPYLSVAQFISLLAIIIALFLWSHLQGKTQSRK